jgi:regulatory protein
MNEPDLAGDRSRQRRNARRSPRERLAFPAGVVTALRSADSAGARYLVSVAGVDGLVSAEMIGDFRLAPGRELSGAEAEALTRTAHRLQVFDLAVSLLSARARSARDLRIALKRRGATDEEVRPALARLGELGLLDDAVYAREVARSRAAQGGMSKRGLQQDLSRRGVAPAVARAAIGDVLDEVGLDEHAAALAVARKRLKSLSGLGPVVARRRLYAFLARRGYEPGVISTVLAEVLAAPAGEDEAGWEAG